MENKIEKIDDLEQFRIINIKLDEDETREWLNEQEYWVPNFVLDNGLIKYKIFNNQMINYFEIYSLSIGKVFYFEQYIKTSQDNMKFMFSCEVVFRRESYDTRIIKRDLKGKGTDKTIKLMIEILISYIYFIDFINKTQETILKNSKTNPIEYKDLTINKREDKTIVISGSKVKYEVSNKYGKKRTNRRLSEEWSVRGHYRHYKNGKTIFIKNYTKGLKKGNEKQRVYDITI